MDELEIAQIDVIGVLHALDDDQKRSLLVGLGIETPIGRDKLPGPNELQPGAFIMAVMNGVNRPALEHTCRMTDQNGSFSTLMETVGG